MSPERPAPTEDEVKSVKAVQAQARGYLTRKELKKQQRAVRTIEKAYSLTVNHIVQYGSSVAYQKQIDLGGMKISSVRSLSLLALTVASARLQVLRDIMIANGP